jgi:hypothetical protein
MNELILRDKFYEAYWKEFKEFDKDLNDEQSTELDGIIWGLAQKLASQLVQFYDEF